MEIPRTMQGMVIIHIGTDFHIGSDSTFNNGTKWIPCSPFGEGKFAVPILHALGADED